MGWRQQCQKVFKQMKAVVHTIPPWLSQLRRASMAPQPIPLDGSSFGANHNMRIAADQRLANTEDQLADAMETS